MRSKSNVGQDGLPDQKNIHKNTHFQQQFQTVFAEFNRAPQTMKEVEVRTGIDRANICWYVRDMRKARTIARIAIGPCPITGHPKVGFYTTNPLLFPKSEPTLFDDYEMGGSI